MSVFNRVSFLSLFAAVPAMAATYVDGDLINLATIRGSITSYNGIRLGDRITRAIPPMGNRE
jgi:hypothetical protein